MVGQGEQEEQEGQEEEEEEVEGRCKPVTNAAKGKAQSFSLGAV